MKTIVTITLLALISSPLAAGTWETRCSVKSVAYQATVNGARPEEVLGGVIIGGVLGKAATGDDAGAAVGAIIGGVVASENNKKTVTKYRDVETCGQVFIPEYINDQAALRQTILHLNNGGSASRERIMDVQYTIGATHDGSWGPRSAKTARAYLASNGTANTTNEAQSPLYTLIVNNVVIVTSLDVNEVNEIQNALLEAGVDSRIFVNFE